MRRQSADRQKIYLLSWTHFDLQSHLQVPNNHCKEYHDFFLRLFILLQKCKDADDEPKS